MNKLIKCPCGYLVQAGSDDELVRQSQEHARLTHDMSVSREQILAMAKPE